ncbi:tetraacyldisaccharide 4'-kinase [bacterium]|nr:tetraacyldisaccharide 4'-kinase [bacterium]
MKNFFSELHYAKNPNIIQKSVGAILFFAVPFYWLASELKNISYKIKTSKSVDIDDVKVISVGNITTGGVGKTPIVAQIANYLATKDNVAILSRGYGGKLDNKEINVVKQDGKILFEADECGDEPFWLAQNTNANVSILTCANRVKSGQFAKEKLNCKFLILDDGFQHQKLKRDIDIIVFDADKLIGNGFVLPLGPLREPLFNVSRADKIILTNKNLSFGKVEEIKKNIEKKFKKDVIVCNVMPQKIYNIKNNNELNDESNKIGAFCGIGQPELFYQYLKDFELIFTQSYSDHHAYSQNDIDDLVKKAQNLGITKLVTTEKDAVKLSNIDSKNVDIYALKIAPNLDIEELLNEKA